MSPNTPNNGGPTQGNGGGRIGAVLLSPYIEQGSVNETPYNHYSLLRSTEDMFGLPHLGYAAREGLKPFEDDVFNAPAGDGFKGGDPAAGPGGGGGGGGGSTGGPPRISLKDVPHPHCVGGFRARVRVRSKSLRNVAVMVDRRTIKRTRKHRFRVRVDADRLRPGHHRLTVRARDRSNRAARKTKVFRACG
jgi:hypothetical protein